jgi:hypothetical protein
MGAERRHATRRRVGQVAMMLIGEATPARFCIVTELSDGGIRINATGDPIPDEFALRLAPRAVPRRYHVIWRFGRDVGARLIDPTPSAEAHGAEIRAT